MSDSDKAGHGLTPQQKAFADAWMRARVANADFSNYELAEAAGYRGTKESLQVAASRTLAHPRVREYLHSKAKDYLREGAVDVAVTLRALSTGARSERVRADTAARLAAGLGLIDQEHGPAGSGVAIQIVFKTEAGALLVQSGQGRAERQVIAGIAGDEHSLAEGEGGAKAARARRATLPPGGQPQPAKAAPASKTGARHSPPGPPRNSPPLKSRGGAGGGSAGISGGRKSRGGGAADV